MVEEVQTRKPTVQREKCRVRHIVLWEYRRGTTDSGAPGSPPTTKPRTNYRRLSEKGRASRFEHGKQPVEVGDK